MQAVKEKLTSGGKTLDVGIPGESMASFPSFSTWATSSAFLVRLPSVPTLVQKLSLPSSLRLAEAA